MATRKKVEQCSQEIVQMPKEETEKSTTGPNEEEKPLDKAAVVAKLVRTLSNKLETDKKLKGSIGDLIKLFELQKELEGDRPKSIEVRWIEPGETAKKRG